MEVKVMMCHDGENGNPDFRAKMPTYGSEKAAGADLYCMQALALKPLMPTLVKTGLRMQIPEGTELQIRPRSGAALSDGLWVLNSPGTIDEDFRGEIGVILCWTGADTTLNKFEIIDGCLHIPAGSRIAQAVLSPVIHAEYVQVPELDETKRGEGGFGSSGLK